MFYNFANRFRNQIVNQIYTYSVDPGWIENWVHDVSSDGKRYILDQVLKETNETWSYNRIILRIFDEPFKTIVLTGGNMSVVQQVGWDDKNEKMYETNKYLCHNLKIVYSLHMT